MKGFGRKVLERLLSISPKKIGKVRWTNCGKYVIINERLVCRSRFPTAQSQLLGRKREVQGIKSHRMLPARALRKLAVKLAVRSQLLPTSFFLSGVELASKESRGLGGFADIFEGKWNDRSVALKRLRSAGSQQKVCF